MSIYKSVSLAVFGSILFIFGYLSSIYFEGKKSREFYAERYEMNINAIHFIMLVDDYERLLEIRKLSDKSSHDHIDNLISLHRPELNNRVKKLESNINNSSFEKMELIYKDHIERAKELLGEN